jgi:hypothetical protein
MALVKDIIWFLLKLGLLAGVATIFLAWPLTVIGRFIGSTRNSSSIPNPKRPNSKLTVILAMIFLIFTVVSGCADFLNFNCKAKSSEAKNNLNEIYQLQSRYKLAHNTYASNAVVDGKAMDCFDLIQWQPQGDTRYNYYCADDVIQHNLLIPSLNDIFKESWPFSVRPFSSNDKFIAMAIGCTSNIKNFADVWMIDQTGKLTQLMDHCREINFDELRRIKREQKDLSLIQKLKIELKLHPNESWKAEIVFLFIPFCLSCIRDYRRARKIGGRSQVAS